MLEFDSLFKDGHVIDPSQNLDGVVDVGIKDGKIVAIAKDLPVSNCPQVYQAKGTYVCPGLVDIHGHWYEGGLYGIDPRICLNHGVTTAVDAGSTGYANFPAFRRTAIDQNPINLFALIHISFLGLHAPFAEELMNISYARPVETAQVIEQNRDRALGVKVRIGSMTGNHGDQALEMALQAAKDARTLLMVHISLGADERAILKSLRAGDILTHCFHGRGNRMLGEDAATNTDLVVEARKRGILFDVGHGGGSFSWDTARRAYEHYFYPDTLSTDLHRYCVGAPLTVSMPQVMSKFLCLGMSLQDAILKTTSAPAKAMGLGEGIGSLKVGGRADVLQFKIEEGEFKLQDTHLETRVGSRSIIPLKVMKDGVVFTPGETEFRLRSFFESDLELFRAMGWTV